MNRTVKYLQLASNMGSSQSFNRAIFIFNRSVLIPATLFVLGILVVPARSAAVDCNAASLQALESEVGTRKASLETSQKVLNDKLAVAAALQSQRTALFSAAQTRFGAKCIASLIKNISKPAKQCKTKTLSSAKRSVTTIVKLDKKFAGASNEVTTARDQENLRESESNDANRRLDQYRFDCPPPNLNPPPPELFLPNDIFYLHDDEELPDAVPLSWIEARYLYVGADGASIFNFKTNGTFSLTSTYNAQGQCLFFRRVEFSGEGTYVYSNGSLDIVINNTGLFTRCSGETTSDSRSRTAHFDLKLLRRYELGTDLERTGRVKLALQFTGPSLTSFDGVPTPRVFELNP